MSSFDQAPSESRAAVRRMIVTACLVGAAMTPMTRGNAQVLSKPYLGTLSYTMAQPSGDTKDFVNNYSWLGFTMEGDWFQKEHLSTGFIFGWQEIYKDAGGTSFDFNNGTITGRTYRHIGSLPILARARYWGGQPGAQFHPFAGLGLGTYWMKQTVDMGIYTADENHWHFGVAPEVGVLFASHGGVGWTLNARYNYPVSTGDYLAGKSASWSYWGIGVGVSYTH